MVYYDLSNLVSEKINIQYVSELLTLFDTLLDAKQDKKEILLIMYDLSSAFDNSGPQVIDCQIESVPF